MELNSFEQRLRWAMDKRGLKQADIIRLAADEGFKLGKSQVSQYVSGKTVPRKDAMEVLSHILDIELSWLQEGVGLPFVDGEIADYAAKSVRAEGTGSRTGSKQGSTAS